MNYLGIDPGVKGAISVLSDNKVTTHRLFGLSETDIYNLVVLLPHVDKAIIEEITTWGMQANAQCILYGSYKFLRACLIARSIPFDDVPPKQWQKEVGITYPKGTSYNERKKIARMKAQQMYPDRTIHAEEADALLILEFLRRREVGK